MKKHKLCIVIVAFLCLVLSFSSALAAPTQIKPRTLAQINILSPAGGNGSAARPCRLPSVYQQIN